MTNKIFNLLLRYNIKFPWFLYHFFNVITLYIYNKGALIYRSEMEYGRAKSFSRYISDESKIKILYKNTNDTDKKFLDEILKKVEYVGNHNLLEYKKVFSKKDEKNRTQFLRDFFSYKKDDIFKKNECFNNLYFIPKIIKRLGINRKNNFDIIDCGGYIGDSAIVFSDLFADSKVHAFEPEQHNYQQLEKNIQIYGKVNKIIPINSAIGSKVGKITITGTGAGSYINDINGIETDIDTIDHYVFSNHLQPGIIKWDIEGAEYDSILGAEKSIKQFKPILFISIYHTGKDFFEIKPLLESWDLGYQFTFDRRNCQTIFADTILIAY